MPGFSQPVGTGWGPGGGEEGRGEGWVSVEVYSMSERLCGARGGDGRSGARGECARSDLTGAGAALSEIRVGGGWKGLRMLAHGARKLHGCGADGEGGEVR